MQVNLLPGRFQVLPCLAGFVYLKSGSRYIACYYLLLHGPARIFLEQQVRERSFAFLLHFFDLIKKLLRLYFHRGFVMRSLSLVRSKQGEIERKYRIVVQIAEGHIVQIKILESIHLVAKFERRLSKKIKP